MSGRFRSRWRASAASRSRRKSAQLGWGEHFQLVAWACSHQRSSQLDVSGASTRTRPSASGVSLVRPSGCSSQQMGQREETQAEQYRRAAHRGAEVPAVWAMALAMSTFGGRCAGSQRGRRACEPMQCARAG